MWTNEQTTVESSADRWHLWFYAHQLMYAFTLTRQLTCTVHVLMFHTVWVNSNSSSFCSDEMIARCNMVSLASSKCNFTQTGIRWDTIKMYLVRRRMTGRNERKLLKKNWMQVNLSRLVNIGEIIDFWRYFWWAIWIQLTVYSTDLCGTRELSSRLCSRSVVVSNEHMIFLPGSERFTFE